MRPKSIELFEKVYLGSIVIGLINTALSWSQVNALMNDPRVQATGMGTGTLVLGVIVGILIPLLLWYFIARRASNVAKWIYVVLTALGLLSLLNSLAVNVSLAPKDLTLIVATVSVLFQVYGAWLLFKPDAVAWLESKGANGPGDPDTFD